MSRQLSQMKMQLDNLNKKYPNNDITYEDGGDNLKIKIDDSDIELDHKLLNEGFEDFGVKFINGVVDMVESNIKVDEYE